MNNSPVSERRDHKTVSAAQELIHVVEVHVGNGDETEVLVFFEVEAGLLQPLEVVH